MTLITMLAMLCELDPPEATRNSNDLVEIEMTERLHALGALAHTGKRRSLPCPVCDDPHSLALEYAGDGRYRCYCPDTGFHDVPAEMLDVYSADIRWIGQTIASCLGRRIDMRQLPTPLAALVNVGIFRFKNYRTQLFLACRLTDHDRFLGVEAEVKRLAGTRPSIIITTTPIDQIAGSASGRTAIVRLSDVLRLEVTPAALDEGRLLAALRGSDRRGPGSGIGVAFSPGYRSAILGDKEYAFTDKQAQVVEALNDAQPGRLHQDEISGLVGTKQRVGQLFRGHPAYGSLIRYDSKGYYWLDV